MAAKQAGTKLDSLTLAAVSPLLFDENGGITEDEWNALKALVQPLRRLRLYTFAEDWDDDEADDEDPGAEEVSFFSDEILQNGNLHELLSAATNLRVLQLQLPSWHWFGGEDPHYSALAESLHGITWPHLYELSLHSCEVHADFLVDLCLRHKATLRRLSLSDMQLTGHAHHWKDVFTRLSGQLPDLREIKLRGSFYVEDYEEMSFDIAGVELRRIAPYRDALEDFVVKGSDWPSDFADILPDYGDYPDESYKPPKRLDDDKKPDDPALDCEEDEFDWKI